MWAVNFWEHNFQQSGYFGVPLLLGFQITLLFHILVGRMYERVCRHLCCWGCQVKHLYACGRVCGPV